MGLSYSASFLVLGLLSAIQLGASFTVVPVAVLQQSAMKLSAVSEGLFAEEPDMVPIAENFIRAKYKQGAKSHGHEFMTKDDARDLLRSLLPPVTPEELDQEVTKTVAMIMKNSENTADRINEDCFVNAILCNSYWREAGDLVVKELMYFDSLHSYYEDGTAVLNNADYEELKENLTWEGSSIATMSAKEAMFVSAVAAARRGESFMADEEYKQLKTALKNQGSWVTDRKPDALEKLGLQTFMGYLHRSLD